MGTDGLNPLTHDTRPFPMKPYSQFIYMRRKESPVGIVGVLMLADSTHAPSRMFSAGRGCVLGPVQAWLSLRVCGPFWLPAVCYVVMFLLAGAECLTATEGRGWKARSPWCVHCSPLTRSVEAILEGRLAAFPSQGPCYSHHSPSTPGC